MDEQTTTSCESTVTKGVFLVYISFLNVSTGSWEVFLFQVEAGSEDDEIPVQARRKLEEEFNVQRAKMKELFLQKEGLWLVAV